MSEERPRGRSEQPLPAEPLPPLPPPWRPQDNAQPLFRRGLGREAGLGPVPSGRSVPLLPAPPPGAARAAHRWFSAREGQAPALLYNNRALRAGNTLPSRRGPSRATPSSGPRPAGSAPRRLARTLGQNLPHYLLAPTEQQRRSPVLPAPLGRQGIPAGTPPHPSPALGRYGAHSIALGPTRVRGVAQHPAPTERAGGSGGRGGKECNAQTLR